MRGKFDCNVLLCLLGHRKIKHLDYSEYKDVMIDDALIERAIKYDMNYINEKEHEIYLDLDYLRRVKSSLELEEFYQFNPEFRKLEKAFKELKELNKDYIGKDIQYLTNELYEDILKLDDSSLGNIKSKKLAEYIKSHPLYQPYKAIYSTKQDKRYDDFVSAILSIRIARDDILELQRVVKKEGVPSKTYKALAKEQKGKRFRK